MQDVKAKLSKVLDTAKRDGPHIITRRGVEAVAVVPIEQWKKMSGEAKPNLLEILHFPNTSPASCLPQINEWIHRAAPSALRVRSLT